MMITTQSLGTPRTNGAVMSIFLQGVPCIASAKIASQGIEALMFTTSTVYKTFININTVVFVVN